MLNYGKELAKISYVKYVFVHAGRSSAIIKIVKGLLWHFPRIFPAPLCEATWVGTFVAFWWPLANQIPAFEISLGGLSAAEIRKIFGVGPFPSVSG